LRWKIDVPRRYNPDFWSEAILLISGLIVCGEIWSYSDRRIWAVRTAALLCFSPSSFHSTAANASAEDLRRFQSHLRHHILIETDMLEKPLETSVARSMKGLARQVVCPAKTCPIAW
jgi:hypothetical protein